MSLMGWLTSRVMRASRCRPHETGRDERVSRETEVLLRQLRAELSLMRRWREQEVHREATPSEP